MMSLPCRIIIFEPKLIEIAILTKILKGIGASLHILIELIVLIVILVAFGIRTSWFQTFLAQQVANYLSGELGTEVTIDKVDISFLDLVDIEGVYVEDKFQDTLLYSEYLHVTIADFSLSNSFVDVEEVTLKNADVNLKKVKGDSTFNFQHIVDYFASDKVTEDTTKSNFKLIVQKVTLADVAFNYQDQNNTFTTYGIDYSNIAAKKLHGSFTNFKLQGDAIFVDINDLQLEEKSGIAINKLSTNLKYSPKAIALKALELNFNESTLLADSLIMETPNGAEDYANFVHDVKLRGAINNSVIDFEDLSLIVPNLKGMNNKVAINNVDFNGPVYGMQLNNTHISLLDSTVIKGNLQIPNLDDADATFNQNIKLFQTSTTDLQKLKLTPFLNNADYIDLPPNISDAGVVQVKDFTFKGSMNKFEVDGSVYSNLGNISTENGLAFEKKEDGLYHYKGLGQNKRDLIVDQLNLRALSGSDMLGTTSGYLTIRDSKGFTPEEMQLNFDGRFQNLTLNGYDYNNLVIKKGKFANNIFDGEIDVRDPNLAMEYDGYINLNNMEFKFDMALNCAELSALNFANDSVQTFVNAKNIHVDLIGTDVNSIKGEAKIEGLQINQEDIDFNLNELDLSIIRNAISDSINISSELIDARLTGRFDLIDIWPVVQHQLARVLDNLVEDVDISKTKNEFFDLRIDLKDINPILPFVDDKIFVAPNSVVTSKYSLEDLKLVVDVTTDSVFYDEMEFHKIHLKNYFDSVRANVQYEVGYAAITDSLHAKNLSLFSYVKSNKFSTNFGWDGDGQIEPGLFAFNTFIEENKDIKTNFKPSFFHLRGQKWNINQNSQILYNEKRIELTDFDITSGDHLISLHGKVSENPADWMYFNVKEFDLADLNGLIGDGLNIGGVLNLKGGVSDVYNNIRFESLSNIKDFIIDGELVGDLNVENEWDKVNKSVKIAGNLVREAKQTLSFKGNYYTNKEKENLNMDVNFDNTDIGFLNAFKDPEMYTDIDGVLNGKLKITGELVDPIIEGRLKVVHASVLVPMFNVKFGIAGNLDFADGEIIVEYMDVFDQESNHAIAQMQIYHYDWEEWNYDITLDMEGPLVSKKFLVMNTQYKDGDLYYGKAYISGDVNIFGYNGLTEVTVNAKTQPGTDVQLAMYGTSDLDESSFIVFDTIIPRYDPNNEGDTKNRIESTGLVLNMNFDVTKDAKVTIVFDPVFEDQIVVNAGAGKITLNMDEYGEMDMFGKYTIYDGNYFMRLQGLVKKDFQIRSGSTVAWTKSPYDALIDINADFARQTSVDPILPPGIEDRSDKKQIVIGTLSMTNTLMSPTLGFSINAPNGDDIEKAALEALNGDKDRLNKQFFALLVLNRFLATEGNGAAGGNDAAYNLAEGQINTILDNVGDNYDLSAELDAGKTALGFQTQVGERITIKTSLGVVSGDDQNSGTIIGDVTVEYRLNEDGTFTVKIFNESNTGSDAEKGPFTQGVGLHYEEQFNTKREFKLLQAFLNIFRKAENDVDYKEEVDNGKKVPVEGALEELEREEKKEAEESLAPEEEELLKNTNQPEPDKKK